MSDIKLVNRYFRGELPRTEKEKDRTMDVMEEMLNFLEECTNSEKNGDLYEMKVSDLYNEILLGFRKLNRMIL